MKKVEKPKRKPKPRQMRLATIDSGYTLADLKQMRAEGPPPREHPEGLRLKDLHVALRVFQCRHPGLLDENLLMTDLASELAQKPPKALAPIVVTAVGTRFFVVDGHHRLWAYHVARWKGRVPVEYFPGSLKEAQAEAVLRNRKNTLPYTQQERMQWAWEKMIDREQDPEKEWTYREIWEAAGVGRSTVKRMAGALRDLGESVWEKPWGEVWRDIQRKERNTADEDGKRDWKERQADKLAKHLMKGPNLTRDPEVTAMALAMVSGGLPAALVYEWSDVASESVLAEVRYAAPDKLEAVEDALRAARNPFRKRAADSGADPANIPDTGATEKAALRRGDVEWDDAL